MCSKLLFLDWFPEKTRTVLLRMTSAADCKLKWSDEAVPVADYIRPLSLRGWLLGIGYLRHARGFVKAALTRIPPPSREFVEALRM